MQQWRWSGGNTTPLSQSYVSQTVTISAVETSHCYRSRCGCDEIRTGFTWLSLSRWSTNRWVYCHRGIDISLYHITMRGRCDDHHARCWMPTARRISPSVGRASNEFMISPADTATRNDEVFLRRTGLNVCVCCDVRDSVVKTRYTKKLIRRWDSERELSWRRHRTRTTKYNRA